MNLRRLTPTLLLLLLALPGIPSGSAQGGQVETACVFVPDEYEPVMPAKPVREESTASRHGYLTWLPVAANGQPTGQWRFTGTCYTASWVLYCAWTGLCDSANQLFYQAQLITYDAVNTVRWLDPTGTGTMSPGEVIGSYYNGPRAPPCQQTEWQPPCEPWEQ